MAPVLGHPDLQRIWVHTWVLGIEFRFSVDQPELFTTEPSLQLSAPLKQTTIIYLYTCVCIYVSLCMLMCTHVHTPTHMSEDSQCFSGLAANIFTYWVTLSALQFSIKNILKEIIKKPMNRFLGQDLEEFCAICTLGLWNTLLPAHGWVSIHLPDYCPGSPCTGSWSPLKHQSLEMFLILAWVRSLRELWTMYHSDRQTVGTVRAGNRSGTQ